MSKKIVRPEKVEQQDTSVSLKLLADLITPTFSYEQGQIIQVTAEETADLQLNYAGYFEVMDERSADTDA